MRMQAKLPRQHGRIMHNPANQEVKRMTRGTRPKEQLKAEKPQECKTTRGMFSLKCGEADAGRLRPRMFSQQIGHQSLDREGGLESTPTVQIPAIAGGVVRV
jgi:hypothetical protein